MLPNDALAACLSIHDGQRRKGPDAVPYAIHPIRVATLLAEFDLPQPYLEAALLHDALEDQPGRITAAGIRERFGHPIALIVEDLTKDKASTRKAYIATFRDKSPVACLVKLADRLDNLTDSFAWNPDYEPAYAEESERLLAAINSNPKVKEFMNDQTDDDKRRERDCYRRAFWHIENILRNAIAKARRVD